MAAGGGYREEACSGCTATSAGSSSCDHWQCCAHSVCPHIGVIVTSDQFISHSATMLDYNEEARKLFATLDGTKPSRFNNLDPIYRSDAGGFIYVGGDLVTQHRFLNSDIYTQYSEKAPAI